MRIQIQALCLGLMVGVFGVIMVFAQAAKENSPVNPLFGTNLIRNGDAEQDTNTMWAPAWQPAQLFQEAGYGRIPGEWEQGVEGAPHGGCCYLRLEWQVKTEQADNSESAFQEIDLTSLATELDRGMVWAELSGYLGGLINGNTATSLTVTWMDANGKEIGELALPSVSPWDLRKPFVGIASLVPRQQKELVPAGTRKAVVKFTGKVTGKGYSYTALADNLSLVLSEGSGN